MCPVATTLGSTNSELIILALALNYLNTKGHHFRSFFLISCNNTP